MKIAWRKLGCQKLGNLLYTLGLVQQCSKTLMKYHAGKFWHEILKFSFGVFLEEELGI